MALSGYTWAHLFVYSISALGISTLAIIMIRSFFKKRTIGSAFLMISFGLIGIGQSLSSVSFWLIAFDAINDTTYGVMNIIPAYFYLLYVIFLYFFATRHILRDNDLTKSIVGIIFGQLVAVGAVLMLCENYGYTFFISFLNSYVIGGTDMLMITPSLYLGLFVQLPIVLFILIRITYNLFVIRQKITDPISKRGMLLIQWSFISIILSLVTQSLWTIAALSSIAVIALFIGIVSGILNVLSMYFGYLGWIFPNWLKRRIQSQAWIVKFRAEMKGKTTEYDFSSSRTIKAELQTIKEVSEP